MCEHSEIINTARESVKLLLDEFIPQWKSLSDYQKGILDGMVMVMNKIISECNEVDAPDVSQEEVADLIADLEAFLSQK